MKFERIRVDPQVLGGAPHIQGTFGPYLVSSVLENLADHLSIIGITNRMPGLTEQDILEAVRYSAEALRLRTLPPDEPIQHGPDVRQLVLNGAMWQQITRLIEARGSLVVQIPTGQLGEDELPSYIVTPGPAIHITTPFRVIDESPAEILTQLAEAFDVDVTRFTDTPTVEWPITIPLSGGAITVQFDLDPTTLTRLDRTLVVGLSRALREIKNIGGTRPR